MYPIINNRANPHRICPFLQSENSDGLRLCSVHQHRPLSCRLYPMKYDLGTQTLQPNTSGGDRCPDCHIDAEDILTDAMHRELLKYSEYLLRVSILVKSGLNVHDIKNNPELRQEFFDTQKEMYETI